VVEAYPKLSREARDVGGLIKVDSNEILEIEWNVESKTKKQCVRSQ
jgi:hypothetical protein